MTENKLILTASIGENCTICNQYSEECNFLNNGRCLLNKPKLCRNPEILLQIEKMKRRPNGKKLEILNKILS
jgi:hypothetical protein